MHEMAVWGNAESPRMTDKQEFTEIIQVFEVDN